MGEQITESNRRYIKKNEHQFCIKIRSETKLMEKQRTIENFVTENCLSTAEFDETIKNFQTRMEQKLSSIDDWLSRFESSHETQNRLNTERHLENQKILSKICDKLGI